MVNFDQEKQFSVYFDQEKHIILNFQKNMCDVEIKICVTQKTILAHIMSLIISQNSRTWSYGINSNFKVHFLKTSCFDKMCFPDQGGLGLYIVLDLLYHDIH